MDIAYGIVILCAIVMFLVVLALYKLFSINKMQNEYNKKIKETNDKLINIQTECAKLRTFKFVAENLVTGQRTDKEVRQKIKELLF